MTQPVAATPSPAESAKAPPLPEPGVRKSDADALERELDIAIEQTMDASDPPSVTQPEVKIHGRHERKDGQDAGQGR